MTDHSGQVATVGRRPPRPARRRGLVLAGKGDGWALWVPVGLWDGLSEKERAQLASNQAALLEGQKVGRVEGVA